MVIKYNIVMTIADMTDGSTSTFTKTFESELSMVDALLYNNNHILSSDVYVLDMFQTEVNAYCTAKGILPISIEVDEFEVVSLVDYADVYFQSPDPSDESLSLRPIIKAFVHPKNLPLKVPTLIGKAYDSTTIIWSWPDDEEFAHYIVTEAIDPMTGSASDKIIAQLPAGLKSYTETGLEPDTAYTRRLINYTDEQTSSPSVSVTVQTECTAIDTSLEQYSVPKNYDFTTQDSEREIIRERFKAFHSGVGDFNDLKVYKQMDADFYQKFKAYLEITGRRIQRERRYHQVGFNYKICLEAMERINEQKGEVTFDLNVYPREVIAIDDYMWLTKPVDVKARLTCDVFLRKPVPADEHKEVKYYKPKYKEVKHGHWEEQPPVIDYNRTCLVISIDCSGSMEQGSRMSTVKASAKKLVDEVELRVAAAGGNSTTMEYLVVAWNDTGYIVVQNANAAQAKTGIDSLYPKYGGGSFTNWYAGMTTWHGHTSRPVVGQIFFTDGFLNVSKSGSKYGSSRMGTGAPASSLPNNRSTMEQCIKDCKTDCGCPTYIVFGCGGDHFDTDYNQNQPGYDILKRWADGYQGATYNYNGTNHTVLAPPGTIGIVPRTKEQFGDSNVYYPGYTKSMEDLDEASLAQQLITGLKIFTVTTVPPVWVDDPSTYEFDGWEEVTEDDGVFVYDIDDYRVETMTIDLPTFTFDETVTPVYYSRPERRAIIPEMSFINNVKLSPTSIYDLILAKIPSTNSYLQGYTQTIGTVNDPGNDRFLIARLHMEDNWKFADEDVFDTKKWADGMEGSVNVYTDMDKLETTPYGDDCYLAGKNNYAMIQGYTDAIIYDGSQYIWKELNAWSNPTALIISKLATSYPLSCRKNKNMPYTGTGIPNHVLDVLECGDDLWFEGLPNGVKLKAGEWIGLGVFKVIMMNKSIMDVNFPITADIIAHNDTIWRSPILNYRFNLEDPDAYTPFYEILPDCNPDSEYPNIVLLHVYYARNVWITNYMNYVASFGDDPIATTSSPYIGMVFDPAISNDAAENVYKWTRMEWKHGDDNGRWIDEYLWFMAKPMVEDIPYYDELPGPGMDTFYGLVNGRYRSDNQDGKQDLRVDTPQFNIPNSVLLFHADKIKIYIMITEFKPADALVSYKWEHPLAGKDSITNVNGDYVTFSSDSVTYKDVEYYDLVQTINMEHLEVFDNKTFEKLIPIQKPETYYEYKNYYLDVTTDNGDVMALRWPNEIIFDENGEAVVPIAFKGVVNATSQWAPRIHNGYYYINQHEYHAYCEFDVEADFEQTSEEHYLTKHGYVSLDVWLRHPALPPEHYDITKDVRAELIQNEKDFQWIDGKGLTVAPFIDGIYYREYLPTVYTSPIIMFPHTLTSAGVINIVYQLENGTDIPLDNLGLEIRSYDVENGKWNDWESYTNNTIPSCPLSCAYQVRFTMEVSTVNTPLAIEDYMCCYLDWKDDGDEANWTNIVTITDHMTTGPYDAEGIYVSKILDFGCTTSIQLEMFESHYKQNCRLFVATHDTNPGMLLLENVDWKEITYAGFSSTWSGRYIRYKIIVPSGEKVYWLHKQLVTQETHETFPFLKSISMSGDYVPTDIVENFINTEAFEIPTDGEEHTVFTKILDLIAADVTLKGYAYNEIEWVRIQCTAPDIQISFDPAATLQYPYNAGGLNGPIIAKTDKQTEIIVTDTPWIFSSWCPKCNRFKIEITRGTPQQFCPIVIEDEQGNAYNQIFDEDRCLCMKDDCCCPNDEFHLTDETKYVELRRNDYDKETLVVLLNGSMLTPDMYEVRNHLIIFNDFMHAGDTIEVRYEIKYSFFVQIDRKADTTTLFLYTDKADIENRDEEHPRKYKVYFETSTRNNKFLARELSLNPIYRTEYNGFIYLTDDHNDAYSINMYCNPRRIKAGGYDSVDCTIEVLDVIGNPIISRNVAVDCTGGILMCDNYVTDMNGCVHLVYRSSVLPCTDTVTAKVILDDGTTLQQSIEIINE